MKSTAYQLVLEAPRRNGDPSTVRELRAILKALLRRHGWRCVRVEPVTTASVLAAIPGVVRASELPTPTPKATR
jgi:hypothetical protein